MKIILIFNKRFYLTPYEETVMIRRLIILLLIVVDLQSTRVADLKVSGDWCEEIKY